MLAMSSCSCVCTPGLLQGWSARGATRSGHSSAALEEVGDRGLRRIAVGLGGIQRLLDIGIIQSGQQLTSSEIASTLVEEDSGDAAEWILAAIVARRRGVT